MKLKSALEPSQLPQNKRPPSKGNNADRPEDYSPPANAEHENAWNLTFIFIYSLLVWRLCGFSRANFIYSSAGALTFRRILVLQNTRTYRIQTVVWLNIEQRSENVLGVQIQLHVFLNSVPGFGRVVSFPLRLLYSGWKRSG